MNGFFNTLKDCSIAIGEYLDSVQNIFEKTEREDRYYKNLWKETSQPRRRQQPTVELVPVIVDWYRPVTPFCSLARTALGIHPHNKQYVGTTTEFITVRK
jgi:hypothetical protein